MSRSLGSPGRSTGMDGGLPRCSRRRVDEMTEDELDYVLGMTDDVAKVHRGRRVRR